MSINQYRPEIDGLRALAVLPVILFHAGFNTFSGGYVGVDIFFVISGFLITNIILDEKKQGTFSLKSFYLRRARRIFPALFFIIFACLPLAWMYLQPAQLVSFSKSLIAVSLFSSNIFFWKSSNYFNISSDVTPLLHTWSLGIEEQFYFLFPALILVCWRFGLKKIQFLLILLGITALFLSEHLRAYDAMASFYLIPTRAWELLMGCLLSILTFEKPLHEKMHHRLSNVLAFAGLLLIGYAILSFNQTTPDPGFYTLIPVVGAALIIGFASQKNWVGKRLSSTLLVGVGLISYSAYLWHQPLFAFARLSATKHPSPFKYFILIVLTLLLAYLTWRFIEKPFRNKNKVSSQKIIYGTGFSLLLMIAIGIVGYKWEGFPSRFQVPAVVAKSFSLPERAECHDINYAHQNKHWFCMINTASENKKFDYVLFGDSHSLQMLPAFEAASKSTGKTGMFTGFGGCPSLLGVQQLIRDDQKLRDCHKLNERMISYMKKNKIKNIFMVSRWTYYTDGGYTQNPRYINYIGNSKTSTPTIENTRMAFKEGLARTIKIYNDAGIHIYFIDQIPAQLDEPQNIYYKAYSSTQNVQQYLYTASVKRKSHTKLQSYVRSVFATHQHNPDINIINFDDILCTNKICPIGTKQGSYYQDNNHLSKLGALRLSNELTKIMSNLS